MHSGDLEISSGARSTGQALWQALQEVQRSFSFAKVPAFCKYLCPSGTFFGALPLMASNEALRDQAGGLFFWKLGILLVGKATRR